MLSALIVVNSWVKIKVRKMRLDSTAASDEVVKPPSHNGKKSELKNHKHKKLLPPASIQEGTRVWK
ncbi:hypothetical protein CBP27_16865, partial [Fischerella thermalis WC542]